MRASVRTWGGPGDSASSQPGFWLPSRCSGCRAACGPSGRSVHVQLGVSLSRVSLELGSGHTGPRPCCGGLARAGVCIQVTSLSAGHPDSHRRKLSESRAGAERGVLRMEPGGSLKGFPRPGGCALRGCLFPYRRHLRVLTPSKHRRGHVKQIMYVPRVSPEVSEQLWV